MSELSRWSIVGKYYGFPECCIQEFASGTSMGKDRKLKGSGYIPCKSCHDTIAEEELVAHINQNRVHPEPFPEDGDNTFNENVFRMLLSDKYSVEEKIFIKEEWDSLIEDILSERNPVDSFFNQDEIEVPSQHRIIPKEYGLFGKEKMASIYKQDAQISGKMHACDLIVKMSNVDEQPFGFSWENTCYVKDYTFENYEPFDGSEPKNILELEDIAIEASIIEWKFLMNEQRQFYDKPLKTRKFTNEELIIEVSNLVKENFYNILVKEYIKNNALSDEDLNMFLNVLTNDVRVGKAMDYTKKIFEFYIGTAESIVLLDLNKRSLQKGYADYL